VRPSTAQVEEGLENAFKALTLYDVEYSDPLANCLMVNDGRVRIVDLEHVEFRTGALEVDGSFFLIMENIDGVMMADLPEDQKKAIHTELEQHLATLHQIKSNGPSGLVIPPWIMNNDQDTWSLKQSESEEFVFCHNDCAQQNIIVDPQRLKIKAIIDWGFAGFSPAFFDIRFYRRRGASYALEGEHDDVQELFELIRAWEKE